MVEAFSKISLSLTMTIFLIFLSLSNSSQQTQNTFFYFDLSVIIADVLNPHEYLHVLIAQQTEIACVFPLCVR